MANNKTTQTSTSVDAFVNSIKDETKRNDSRNLIAFIKDQTGLEPKMWGSAIVGFGSHHYRYESGREGDSPNIAFSPRVSSIAIYLSANFEDREMLLKQLGKYKADKGCVHIKRLADIDMGILQKMISNHLKHIQKLYPNQ